jgi:hypothetical protein
MSKLKITPGPWYIKDGSHIADGKRIGAIDILDQPDYEMDVKHIANVNPYGGIYFPEHERALKYARLIAAAPDMFEAIQCALNLKDLWSAQQSGTVSADHSGEMEALQAMQDKLEAAIAKATGQPATTKASISL